jgi:hypothetical protein
LLIYILRVSIILLAYSLRSESIVVRVLDEVILVLHALLLFVLAHLLSLFLLTFTLLVLPLHDVQLVNVQAFISLFKVRLLVISILSALELRLIAMAIIGIVSFICLDLEEF